MKLPEQIVFPPFRLDPANEQLWREGRLVPLRPKAFALLRFLVERAGRLVTKEELLKGVWPDTRVHEAILKGYIHNLREVLDDDAQQPRFIETVPRRGHRFIAPLTTTSPPVQSSNFQVQDSDSGLRTLNSELTPALSTQYPTPLLVGRGAELARLHTLFAKTLGGERQIVFVTGEPGIGKTTLVESFLQNLASSAQPLASEPFQGRGFEPAPSPQPQAPPLWLGRGQCVEQHGAGEAYLPVLEALGRIGRAAGGEHFVAILHQYAPTWLGQMPALLAAEELEILQRRVVGATRERMLRELVEAIEALTAQRPLVLWLEDLHWADASTVDWLAAVAQRSAPARLLVIGTYRPSDLSLSDHPLRAIKQELVAKGQCEELWLPFLSADNVTHYLTRRYLGHHFPAELGATIHQRTDGNPLFVVNMVEYLAAQGVIAEVGGHWRLQTLIDEVGRGVPENLRQLIEKHLERLSETQQRLLEVASVAGVTFSTVAVAAGTEASVEHVEEWCEGLLKRGQFLQAQEPRVLPDGTLCGSYGFQHALQQAVVYERIPNLRRLRLHRRIGEGEEQQYGKHVRLIAAELAAHFERGGNLLRAVEYRQHAGHNALRQHGYQEAISHFTRGLDLLATCPDSPERRQHELTLQIALGSPLQALQGYSAPEVEKAYSRALELCRQVGKPPQLFSVLRGLWVCYVVRSELQTVHELGEELLRIAQSAQDPALLVEAHFALGQTLLFLGELTFAREHLEQGIALYNPQQHSSHAFLYGQDPGVFCYSFMAIALWLLGFPDQAMKKSCAALTLAQELSHPHSLASALDFAAGFHRLRREDQAALEGAEAVIAFSREQGFPFWLAAGTITQGWALAERGQLEEGIVQMCQGMAAYRTTGAGLVRPYSLALLAETYGKVGQIEEGFATLTEALTAVRKTGECTYEAELYRLKGELLLAQESKRQKAKGERQKAKTPNTRHPTPSTHAEAEACFLKAIDIARHQQAKSLELRATTSLVRLRQRQASQPGAGSPEWGAKSQESGLRSQEHEARTRLAEAHMQLFDIYNWFIEGLHTKDLQEAKALLHELAINSPSVPKRTAL